MFIKRDGEVIRCVIGAGYKKKMIAMGWVGSVDELPDDEQEVDPVLKAKAKELKIKGYTKMTNDELKEAIESCE